MSAVFREEEKKSLEYFKKRIKEEILKSIAHVLFFVVFFFFASLLFWVLVPIGNTSIVEINILYMP